jgi:hypothetical protein
MYQSASENSCSDILKQATESIQDSVQQRSKLCKWPNCLNTACHATAQSQALSETLFESTPNLTA